LVRVTEPTSLGNDLLRSAARLSRWASRHASFDVPFAQARLLALLDELGPSRVSALAAADHSSQPSITTQLHRLEAAGWVDRAVDPDDARASLVSLSPAGKDALEHVRRARVAVLAPALDGLDGPALARVRVAIVVLVVLLDAAAEPPSHPTRKDG
jgi:DNA-binding MarR family transcriptional regulator